MATLAGNTIASTYPLLLKIDSSGIDGTLRAVEDGDGTDSALSIATDSVLVKGDGVKLYFYDADGGEHISANTGGVLSIAGASEIDLTATAIDINGTVDMSSTLAVGGDVTITSATSGKPHLTITNTNADGSAPQFIMKKNPSDDSSADNDEVGRIYMYGDDDAGNPFESILIRGITTDVSNGSEDSRLEFLTYKAGAQVSTLALDSGNVGIGAAPDSATRLLVDHDQNAYTRILVKNTSTGTSAQSVTHYETSAGSFTCGAVSDENSLDGAAVLWHVPNKNMVFATNNTPRMTIQNDGNVGIGTTNPAKLLEVSAAVPTFRLNSTEGNVGVGDILGEISWKSADVQRDGDPIAAIRVINTESNGSHSDMTFLTGEDGYDASEKMRITGAGNVGFGTTGTPNGTSIYGSAFVPVSYNRSRLAIACSNAGDLEVVQFFNPNGQVGSISTHNSGTAFTTSSDYRLKENEVLISDGLTRLNQLKPYRFNFKSDADKTVDGFFAHEVSDIVPEAIHGEKDAMQTEEYTVSEALGEVFTPAVEEVTEERQVTETVETGSYVNLAGETITETQDVGVTEEATETVIERQDIDGVMTEVEVEKVTQKPVMETVVTTEAVAEVILETDVQKPEELTEGQWRETTAKVTAEREVLDMQGIDQSKLVPLLVASVKELSAKVEALENA